MNILLLGSGGRESALAWKLRRSPQLKRLWVSPGNAGIPESLNLELSSLPEWCRRESIDLVVVGPEGPLAEGLADRLQEAGIRVFGPTQRAAEIESSKAFSKEFMRRHNIPTGDYRIFEEPSAARDYLLEQENRVVLKASGLAAGKGVLLPETLEEALVALEHLMIDKELGTAAATLLIEQRLEGPEVSLLAFCDGESLSLMPTVTDYKRLGDGDTGPNTGGMGAVSPAPFPSDLAGWTSTIMQPALDGLRAEGRPFVGVLYAGLMLTDQGPKVLEFNCRFGDPETQVLMPLLDDDLIEIMLACVEGRLASLQPRWSSGAAACVVLASEGYPGKLTGLDRPVEGIPRSEPDNGAVFTAGVARRGPQSVTSAGRVAAATGWGPDPATARQNAYALAEKVHFRGRQMRRDVGAPK